MCEGAVDFTLPPMGSIEIHIPEVAEKLDGDVYISFIFRLKKDTLYCEKGYEICFDRIKLRDGEMIRSAPQNVPIRSEDEPLSVTVTAGETVYRFNKRLSAFDSVKRGGAEILDQPMQFNFFRAPVDNDVMNGGWYRARLNDFTVRNYCVKTEQLTDSVEISMRQSFGWSIHQPFAYMDVK